MKQYMQTVEDEYEYDGWLVFNGLYFTEVVDDYFDPQSFVDELRRYTEGTPQTPTEGYRETGLEDDISRIGDLSGGLANLAEDLHTFEYIDENWFIENGFDKEGNRSKVYKPNHQTLQIFWNYDDIMLFRATKIAMERKMGEITSDLSKKVELNRVDFDFDFLLWLLYKCDKNADLRTDLKLQRIDTGSTGHESTGEEINVAGVPDLTRSVPFISTILDGNRIESLEGEFAIQTNYVVAQISSEGRVHVKASRRDLTDLNHLRRMGIAVKFLTEFLRLYKEWTNLSPDDRYPPPEFFDRLVDICEEEDYVPIRDPTDLKNEYRIKRKDSKSDGSAQSTTDTA